MKICKIKPSNNTCCSCLDGQIQHGVILDCKMCEHTITSYELLSVGTRLFSGDYAMVLANGKIKKVPLESVYDVKHVTPEAWAMLNKSMNLPKDKE